MKHCIRALGSIITLCVLVAATSSMAVVQPGALAAMPMRPQVDRAEVPTGILYDLALPIAHAERYDGSTTAPAANAATLRQVVFELTHASLDAPAWPDAQTFRDDGNPMRVRIGLVDVRYDRIRDGATDTGAARVEGDRLVLAAGATETRHAFVAAPLRGYTYRGSDLSFVLDPRLFVSTPGAGSGGTVTRPARVEADFGDGAGWREIRWNTPVAVHYPRTGNTTVHLRATDASDVVRNAAFNFEVRALTTPAPNDTIPLAGTMSYNGGTATGRAFVYLSSIHSTLTRPAVVIEGFDLDNTMNWDELYALLNEQGLVEELRTRGYDTVVLDFTDATEYIERNAFVLVDLLHQVQSAIDPGQDFPLVGASMGGLVARYALCWMEQNADPYRVRNFISFDVPHAGANIPLGIQYWLDFFSGQSTDAAFLLSRLDTPAARQMLLYHHTTPAGATGVPDPLRGTFTSELSGLGDFPTQPRLVALSNGSGVGATQGFNPGDQIILYQYSNILVNIRGNVWAVPDNVSTKIFDGYIKPLFLPAQSLVVTVSGTLPWDGAPGGSRNSMAQMDSVVAPYGDIIALHDSHCFIPTISALDISTTDPFYDIAGDPDLVSHTPFANVYVPPDNQPHITVTPENAGVAAR